MIGENSELLLDELVYGRDENKVTGAFRMVSGAIRFASAGVPMDFLIKTPTATIGIRGTQFDVLVDQDRTEVAVIEGLIQVQSRFGVVDVGTGQIYRVSTQQAVFLQTQSGTDAKRYAIHPGDAAGQRQRARVSNPAGRCGDDAGCGPAAVPGRPGHGKPSGHRPAPRQKFMWN